MCPNEEINQAEEMAEDTPAAEEVQAEPSELDLLKTRIAETEDRYKRVLAEYQNFRTRSQKEREGMYLDNVAATAANFLPVIDTLERAMTQETDEAFKKSLDMILKQFTGCMDKLGVKAYGARGDQFDPNFHNAVMMAEDPELESGQIVEVLLKGYTLGDRVVRHAMVRVAE